MNDSAKIWVLCGLVMVMGTIGGFLAKWFFNEVISILSEIKDELKAQSKSIQSHDYQLSTSNEMNKQMNERLNRHSYRIEELEKEFIRHKIMDKT